METQPTQQAPTPIVQTAVQPTTNSFAGALTKENQSMSGKKKKMFLPALIAVICLGLVTGLVAAKVTTPAGTQVVETTATPTEEGAEPTVVAVKVGQVTGAKDASAFKDTVEGVLVAGGVGGEGSHHIVRSGGASQNVYLTSSVLELKLFEGHRVKVSGETFKAQKAGWLMDVGRVEVKELNAALPDGSTPKPADSDQDE
jgi:hypothetical protein